MGRLFVYFFLGSTAFAGIVRPWIGVTAIYLVVLMVPQDIWWWHFSGTRPVFTIMIPTLIGFFFFASTGGYNIRALFQKRYIYIMLLWLCYFLSYALGPYTDQVGPYRWFDPAWMMTNLSKMFVLFFVACLVIDDERKIKIFVSVLIFATLFLTYWINDQYLFQGRFGRIGGPQGLSGIGTYTDENSFAAFFVGGLPFLYYAGFVLKQRFFKYAFWLAIPLGWHAIFLTGSRGGLIAVCACIMFIVYRSRKLSLGIIAVLLFSTAFIWQAGDVMKRRAGTIGDFAVEDSARSRLEAWQAAINMVKNYPLTGVGLASFGVAYPDHSDKKPREAHNTFFQVIAESGVAAGILYLMVLFAALRAAYQNSKMLKNDSENDYQIVMRYINEAAFTSLVGLSFCSAFLTMNLSELTYYIIAIIYIIQNIIEKRDAAVNANP